MKRKKLDPEIEKKVIRYIKEDKQIISKKGKRILLKESSLSKTDNVTRARIKELQKAGYKVFSQAQLFD